MRLPLNLSFILIAAYVFTLPGVANAACGGRFFLQSLFERTKAALTGNLKNDESLLSYGIGKGDRDFKLRKRLVAMAKNPELRDGLRTAIYSDLYAQSDAVLAQVEKAVAKGEINEAAQVYDVLSFGSGPHDSISMRSLSEANPRLKVATLESGERVGATFDKEGFNVNSLTRKGKKGAAPVKGAGNQNELAGGLIQTADIDPAAYTNAQQLADVILMNRASVSKEAPVLFDTEILRVEERANGENWPARYKVKTNRGDFYANHILNNTGLGRELKLPKTISSANRTMVSLERAMNRLSPNDPPKIQSVADYFNYIQANPDGFKKYSGKKVAVIGAGDSSNTLLESLLGLGPTKSYGNAVAQDGRFSEAIWIGQNKKDCEELLNGLRIRYGDLVGGVKSGQIKPDPNALFDIEKLSNGQFKITTKAKDGVITSQTFDQVIFGTGFEDESPNIFESLLAKDTRDFSTFKDANGKPLPFNETPLLVAVKGNIPGTNNANIGKQLVTETAEGQVKHSIHFNGPSAGALVAKEDLRNVNENVASLFNTGPRTQALVQELFTNLKPGNFARIKAKELEPILLTPLTESFNRLPRYSITTPTQVKAAAGVDDIVAKSVLFSNFENFASGRALNVKVNIVRDPAAEGRFIIDFPVTSDAFQAAEKTRAEIASVIQSNPIGMQSIQKMVGKNSSFNTVAIDLHFGANGKLEQLKSNISFLRAGKPNLEGSIEVAKSVRPGIVPQLYSRVNPVRIVKDNPDLYDLVVRLQDLENLNIARALNEIGVTKAGVPKELSAYVLADRIQNLNADAIKRLAEKAFTDTAKRDEFILSQVDKLKEVNPEEAELLVGAMGKNKDLLAAKINKRFSVQAGSAQSILTASTVNAAVAKVKTPEEFIRLFRPPPTGPGITELTSKANRLLYDELLSAKLENFATLTPRPTYSDYRVLESTLGEDEVSFGKSTPKSRLVLAIRSRAFSSTKNLNEKLALFSSPGAMAAPDFDRFVSGTLVDLQNAGANAEFFRNLAKNTKDIYNYSRATQSAMKVSKNGAEFEESLKAYLDLRKLPANEVFGEQTFAEGILQQSDTFFGNPYRIEQAAYVAKAAKDAKPIEIEKFLRRAIESNIDNEKQFSMFLSTENTEAAARYNEIVKKVELDYSKEKNARFPANKPVTPGVPEVAAPRPNAFPNLQKYLAESRNIDEAFARVKDTLGIVSTRAEFLDAIKVEAFKFDQPALQSKVNDLVTESLEKFGGLPVRPSSADYIRLNQVAKLEKEKYVQVVSNAALFATNSKELLEVLSEKVPARGSPIDNVILENLTRIEDKKLDSRDYIKIAMNASYTNTRKEIFTVASDNATSLTDLAAVFSQFSSLPGISNAEVKNAVAKAPDFFFKNRNPDQINQAYQEIASVPLDVKEAFLRRGFSQVSYESQILDLLRPSSKVEVQELDMLNRLRTELRIKIGI